MEPTPLINNPGLSAKPTTVQELLGVTYQEERKMREVVRALYNAKMPVDSGVEYDKPLNQLLKLGNKHIKEMEEAAISSLDNSGFVIISRAPWYPQWVFAQLHVRRCGRRARMNGRRSQSSTESVPEHGAAIAAGAAESGSEVGAEVGSAGAGAGADVVVREPNQSGSWRPW